MSLIPLIGVFTGLVFIVGTITSGNAAESIGEALIVGCLRATVGAILLAVAWFITKGILAP